MKGGVSSKSPSRVSRKPAGPWSEKLCTFSHSVSLVSVKQWKSITKIKALRVRVSQGMVLLALTIFFCVNWWFLYIVGGLGLFPVLLESWAEALEFLSIAHQCPSARYINKYTVCIWHLSVSLEACRLRCVRVRFDHRLFKCKERTIRVSRYYVCWIMIHILSSRFTSPFKHAMGSCIYFGCVLVLEKKNYFENRGWNCFGQDPKIYIWN